MSECRSRRQTALLAARAFTVPEGESGDWRVERFTVTKDDEKFERMRALFSGGRFVPAGNYTWLKRGGTTVMSDTPDELMDQMQFYHRCDGAKRVLINGLGLGCAVRLILTHSSVEHVDVVECSEDVIKLVGKTFENDPRVHIHLGDAYTYQFPAGSKWDVVWHDVWDNIQADNDFSTLHRRYGRRSGWQGSWCRAEAERYR